MYSLRLTVPLPAAHSEFMTGCKLKAGFTPAEGYEVNAEGFVMPKGQS